MEKSNCREELSFLTAAKAYETKFPENCLFSCTLNHAYGYQDIGSCKWEGEKRTLKSKASRFTYYCAKLIYFNSSLKEKYFDSFNSLKSEKDCAMCIQEKTNKNGV